MGNVIVLLVLNVFNEISIVTAWSSHHRITHRHATRARN